MFKYAPGMESGLGAALNMMRKHAEPDGDEGTTVTNIFNMEDKESGMNDIAGLMALMQNNKGMDLPGILALCQQKGYGREGGGWGDGMGLLVILLFFLMFNNGGWGNNGNKACAEGLVGADNCQRIIGLHDRISAVRDCCCKVEAQLATVLCEIRGVQRDIRESSGLINAKIELEALKAENAHAAMECRLVQAQKDCCCEMNQRFDRLDCKLDNMQRDSEIARLTRENEALKNKAIADSTAASVVQSLQGFAISHYKPTQTATAPTA